MALSLRLFHVGLILGSLLLPTTPVSAQTSRDGLLRLVPEDVGICLVIQDLRGHKKAFLGSAFVEKFRASPFGGVLRNPPEPRKLMEAEQFFQDRFKIDWPRLLDDILGDTVVLAYWPGPPGKPEQEQGMILVRAHDAQLLAGLI